MIKRTIFLITVLTLLMSLSAEHRHVKAFEDTNGFRIAKACEKNDVVKIDKLVKKNPKSIHAISNYETNLLQLCIDLEKLEAFKKLLELGANPNYVNEDSSKVVLHSSLKYHGSQFEWRTNFEFTKLLLDYGADPNQPKFLFKRMSRADTKPKHPITEAAGMDLEAVKLLVKYGAKPVTEINQSTLGAAASYARIDVIYYLVDSLGVDLTLPLNTSWNGDEYIQDYVARWLTWPKEDQERLEIEKLIAYLKEKGIEIERKELKK